MKSKHTPLNTNILHVEKAKQTLQKNTEKTESINKLLISLRRSHLNFAKDNRALQAKMQHFNKMFHSVEDEKRTSYIQFFLKVDNWPLNK
jgi:hypothetical protein